MRQVVNLRTAYATRNPNGSPRFGDDATTESYQRRCEEARRRQRVRFAVAPDQTLQLRDGSWLHAGAGVDPAMLDWQDFEQALLTGVILEAYHLPEPPTAA